MVFLVSALCKFIKVIKLNIAKGTTDPRAYSFSKFCFVKGVDLGNFLRHFLFGTEKSCSLFVFLLSVEVFHCCNASSAV